MAKHVFFIITFLVNISILAQVKEFNQQTELRFLLPSKEIKLDTNVFTSRKLNSYLNLFSSNNYRICNPNYIFDSIGIIIKDSFVPEICIYHNENVLKGLKNQNSNDKMCKNSTYPKNAFSGALTIVGLKVGRSTVIEEVIQYLEQSSIEYSIRPEEGKNDFNKFKVVYIETSLCIYYVYFNSFGQITMTNISSSKDFIDELFE